MQPKRVRMGVGKWFWFDWCVLEGSWWYNTCTMCNPTARYLRGNVTEADRWQIVYWDGFRGSAYSLKKVGMMVRPRGRYSSNVLPVKQ